MGQKAHPGEPSTVRGSTCPLAMENNLSASRQARRFLDDRLRDDWADPEVPSARSPSVEQVRNAQDFRERYYAESESGDSNTDDDDAPSPYKFDSPDSIGDAVAQTREARRLRRRARLEKEMAENEGLRIWVAQRDLWTGAASVKKYGCQRQAQHQHQQQAEGDPSPDALPSPEDDIRPTPTSTTAPGSQPTGSTAQTTFDLVPVAPRLLAANPIRASITPKAYSDIFQKIVVSSRTPSVPINLADMTRALVQGWKDTDEWPPRPGLLDPLAGKKRSISGATVNGHNGGFMERHPHLEKSVDSVKRILHLNGHHNSQEHTEAGKEG